MEREIGKKNFEKKLKEENLITVVGAEFQRDHFLDSEQEMHLLFQEIFVFCTKPIIKKENNQQRGYLQERNQKHSNQRVGNNKSYKLDFQRKEWKKM